MNISTLFIMKSIDTLVKDIYDLFDPLVDAELNEKEVDAHLDSFTESLKETLKNFLRRNKYDYFNGI